MIAEDRPDFILIHGDTQTAVCGGMVGFFHKIPVGHVEAGLRSHNKFSPWPAEPSACSRLSMAGYREAGM